MERSYSYSEALELRLNTLAHNQRAAVRNFRATYETRYIVAPWVGFLSAFPIAIGLGLLASIIMIEELSVAASMAFAIVGLLAGFGVYSWILSTIPPLTLPPRPDAYRGPIEGLNSRAWADMQRLWGFKCAYCGTGVSEYIGESPHREHVIPLSRGGANRASNVVPACSACNLSKHTLTGSEYVAARRRAGLIINPDWERHRS